jgi:hypothetical protein
VNLVDRDGRLWGCIWNPDPEFGITPGGCFGYDPPYEEQAPARWNKCGGRVAGDQELAKRQAILDQAIADFGKLIENKDGECYKFLAGVLSSLANIGFANKKPEDILSTLNDPSTGFTLDPETDDSRFCGNGDIVADTSFSGFLWWKHSSIALGVRFFTGDGRISTIGKTENFVLGTRGTVIGHEGIHALLGVSDVNLFLYAPGAKWTGPGLLPTPGQASEEFNKLLYSKCKQ